VRKSELIEQIDKLALIALAQQLVQIPSENPPGNEKAVAERVLTFFEELDVPAKVIEAAPGRPNILAHITGSSKGKGPKLLFNGHMDVVPAGPDWHFPAYSGRVENGRLYGRGSCDMKGGLAAMLFVAKLFRDFNVDPKGVLQFAVVADEEAGGKNGTGYLVENKMIDADMAIVAEPSDFKLSISEGGILWIELTTHGTPTHTINAKTAINAVQKMAKVIMRLEEEAERLRQIEHPKYGSPILTVNVVHGGLKTNLIPGDCKALVDFRFPPAIEMSVDSATSRIEGVLAELHHEDPRLDITAQFTTVAHPFEQNEDIEVVRILKESAKELTGRYPDWWREGKKATIPTDDSDVYHLWAKGGIPSVYFGPGKLEQCHTVDEWIATKDIVKAAKIYALTALNVLTDFK